VPSRPRRTPRPGNSPPSPNCGCRRPRGGQLPALDLRLQRCSAAEQPQPWLHRIPGSAGNRPAVGYLRLHADPARLAAPRCSEQTRSFDGSFGAHTQELAREEHAYAQKLHANGTRHVYRARTTRWVLEGGVLVGGALSSTSYCYRTLSADSCPGTGTEFDFATQRRTVTTRGTALSNPAFTPAFWGDVPVRAIPSQSQKRT